MKHLPLLAALVCLLALAGCGAPAPQPPPPEETVQEEPVQKEPAQEETPTLEALCGPDYRSYLTETITMQMGNRMDKDPSVSYFPIAEASPLTDYAAIDETTAFSQDPEGHLILRFPPGAVADVAHGEQTFRIPLP